MPAASLASNGTLTCPECGLALPFHALDPNQELTCTGCRRPLRGQVFRRWSAPDFKPALGSERALDGDAVCFFHASNRAALACDACGRFVCTVCDLQVGARHLCPACLSTGLDKQKLPEIVPRRFLWSQAALVIGLLGLFPGLIMWPFVIVSGPLGIFFALFGWKRPGSLVTGQRHWMAVVGIILCLAQIVTWFTIIFLISAAQKR